ncbi:VanZ family protein [Niallia taxi]|uniref:VanZ family protein n=1 Tax=Niallia taxi TaxID=2499688 RepID=A0A437K5P0_9BACI|nr:VanZ family protein [Niallia taxi]RVT58347.1 VanZ family protein [Niallia taxi]
MVRRFSTWAGYLFFTFYLLILLYLLFFSSYRHAVKGEISYNFIPFASILLDIRELGPFHLAMMTNNLFGNILAFVPLGFFLPLLFRRFRHWKYSFICSLLLSISVELLQLIGKVGACDVDDVILNTIGGLCGYICWRLLAYPLIKRQKKLT